MTTHAIGVDIVRRALPEPAYLIAANAGYAGRDITEQIAGMDTDDGFDALEGRYGNMVELGIIDPLRVARSALQNGASVAGLLLTATREVLASHREGAGQPGRDRA